MVLPAPYVRPPRAVRPHQPHRSLAHASARGPFPPSSSRPPPRLPAAPRVDPRPDSGVGLPTGKLQCVLVRVVPVSSGSFSAGCRPGPTADPSAAPTRGRVPVGTEEERRRGVGERRPRGRRRRLPAGEHSAERVRSRSRFVVRGSGRRRPFGAIRGERASLVRSVRGFPPLFFFRPPGGGVDPTVHRTHRGFVDRARRRPRCRVAARPLPARGFPPRVARVERNPEWRLCSAPRVRGVRRVFRGAEAGRARRREGCPGAAPSMPRRARARVAATRGGSKTPTRAGRSSAGGEGGRGPRGGAGSASRAGIALAKKARGRASLAGVKIAAGSSGEGAEEGGAPLNARKLRLDVAAWRSRVRSTLASSGASHSAASSS